MADILTGRFGRAVQALFNLNQPLTLGQILPDVFPSVDIENLNPELRIFSGEDLCAGVAERAALAANFSSVYLQLPPASGKVVIIERILASCIGSSSNARLSRGFNTVGMSGDPATTLSVFRDSRRSSPTSTARPAAAMRTAHQLVAGIAPFADLRCSANGQGTYDGPIVLAGNDRPYVYVEAQTANVPMVVSFIWRERILGQQEASA